MGSTKSKKIAQKSTCKSVQTYVIGSNANELKSNNTAKNFQIDRTVAKYWHKTEK